MMKSKRGDVEAERRWRNDVHGRSQEGSKTTNANANANAHYRALCMIPPLMRI
jgi:hypothetical protein